MEEKIRIIEEKIKMSEQKDRYLLKRNPEGKSRKVGIGDENNPFGYATRVLASHLLDQRKIVVSQVQDARAESQNFAKNISVDNERPRKMELIIWADKDDVDNNIEELPETPVLHSPPAALPMESIQMDGIESNSSIQEILQVQNIETRLQEDQKQIMEMILKIERNNLELEKNLQTITTRKNIFDESLLALEENVNQAQNQFDMLQEEKLKIESHYDDYISNFSG